MSRKIQKKIFKVIILFLIVVVFIALSEVIYIIKNRPVYYVNFLSSYYITKVQSYSEKTNITKTFFFLEKAADLKISEQKKFYSGLIPDYDTKIPLDHLNNVTVYGKYTDYLLTQNLDDLAEYDSFNLARVFYMIGLMAYRNNQSEMIIPSWQTAIYLAPEWSYFHLELTNYYLYLGDIEKAKSKLDYCLEFSYPRQHCNNYLKKLNEEMVIDYSDKVGFWEDYLKGE